ncbi:MAG: long-chain fatty acid--CoA ligase [Gemmatimonadota bacterium]
MATVTATEKYAANPATLPEGTLVELFFQPIDRFNRPDAQRHRSAAGWQTISHAQLLDDVRAIAAAFEARGIKSGDRVGLLSENRPEWAHTDYALLCLGALVVPLYGTLPPNQIAFILKDAGVRAVVVSNPDQLAKILEIAGELPQLEFMVVFDAPAQLPPRVHAWKALLTQGRSKRPDEQSFRQRALRAKPDDLATIIYTSGTTAEPKGVMLTHNNIFSNVLAQAWLTAQGGSDNVALSFLPLSHIFQRMVDYCVYYNGVPIAYVASIDEVAQALREVEPTLVVAVPRVYEKLYARIMSATGVKRRLVLWARRIALAWADYKLNGRAPPGSLRFQHAIADKLVFTKIRASLGGHLRFFVSGGAPLNPTLANFFYGAGVLILEGYGLTETSPVTNVNRPDAVRMGTVGKPVAGTEIKIAEDGEVLVRGPQVMKGYYNNVPATQEAIDAEGWFHTGDIGDIDADGYLRITDRKKELIVTAGGKKIVPQPIQNLAKQSRFVADALIIGDKRPFPIMMVVPNFSTLESWAAEEGIRWSNRSELVQNPKIAAKIEGEVKQRLRDLARYELPKKFLILDREFDMEKGEITPKLSIKRRVVEQNFSQGIEGLYEGASADPGDR